jgi:hypothetical protein
MSKAVQTLTLSPSRDILFNKLVLSQSNVRHMKAGVSIEQLAESIDLAEGLQLRRVRVMGARRIELSGFSDGIHDRLKPYGLFHEIISWKLRMFGSTEASGVGLLAKVLECYPVDHVCERVAA